MVFVLILLLASSLGYSEVSFREPPTVARSDGKFVIAFAVSAATDVEVAIVDADGKVVRHLAAGVIGGGNPPPQPLGTGLSQKISWDGRDDFGIPVPVSGNKARVRLGTSVSFSKFFGGDPCALGQTNSLASDEDGNVYLMNDRWVEARQLRVFKPDGSYLRTVMPFPADVAPDGMKDIAAWDAEAKTFRPRQNKVIFPEFYTPAEYNWGNADLAVIGANKHGVFLLFTNHLCRLDPRGGVPGPSWIASTIGNFPGNEWAGPTFAAVSPDGKTAYCCGPIGPNSAPGQIWSLEIGQNAFAPFAKTETNGNANGGRWVNRQQATPPEVVHGPLHQLTVDGDGFVYVADRDNACIQVFDRAGKAVGRVAVDFPDLVQVHPKTKEIYVLSWQFLGPGTYQKRLTKFAPWKTGKQLATLDLGAKPEPGQAQPILMAVSAGEHTRVWIRGRSGAMAIYEERGDQFVPAQTAFSPKPGAQEIFSRMTVDPERETVYVNNNRATYWRYDGESGEMTGTFNAGDIAVGYDGLLYARTTPDINGSGAYDGPLERFDRDFKPAPYAKTGKNVVSPYIYGRMGWGFADRGIGVGPDGKVYSAWMYMNWVHYALTGWDEEGQPLTGRFLQGRSEPDIKRAGSLVDSAIIGPIPQATGGVKVDLQGNIYLGTVAWPKDVPQPKGMNGEGYLYSTGSVLKFPAEGGTFADLTEALARYRTARSGVKGIELQIQDEHPFAEGALAVYPGLGPFSMWNYAGNTCCVCRSPRFDLDRYGRIVMPNAIANHVKIFDNAGNEILTFGAYGNYDSQFVPAGASKPVVAIPEIPLSWPVAVGISDKYIYVSDLYSRRVVRVALGWKKEESVPVPATAVVASLKLDRTRIDGLGPIAVTVEALRQADGSCKGSLEPVLPAGWTSSPAKAPVELSQKGDRKTVVFTVTPCQPLAVGRQTIGIKFVDGSGGVLCDIDSRVTVAQPIAVSSATTFPASGAQLELTLRNEAKASVKGKIAFPRDSGGKSAKLEKPFSVDAGANAFVSVAYSELGVTADMSTIPVDIVCDSGITSTEKTPLVLVLKGARWTFPQNKPGSWILDDAKQVDAAGPGLHLQTGGDGKMVIPAATPISAGDDLEVTMATNAGSVAQLFWGQPLSEENSLKAQLTNDGKPHVYHFKFDRAVDPHQLRFDPCDAPARVDIVSIEMK